jgi:hypothetical protein
VKFDPAFVLRMDEMKEQAMDCTDTFLEDGEDPDPMGGKDSADDADADASDNDIECEMGGDYVPRARGAA